MSTNNVNSVTCAVCSSPLKEKLGLRIKQRHPCPTCGSKKRNISIEMQDSITLRETLYPKGRHSGKKKPFFESISGDDFHRKTGEWMKKLRVIDRDKNEYKEIVTDPKTNSIVHKCEEPLSKHTGHGSEQKLKKKK
jgi:hypothetical protein